MSYKFLLLSQFLGHGSRVGGGWCISVLYQRKRLILEAVVLHFLGKDWNKWSIHSQFPSSKYEKSVIFLELLYRSKF